MKKTMKNLSILTFLILLFSNCKNSNTQNFSTKTVSDTIFSFVTVDFYRETSKDSHHYSTTLSLKKGILYYDYNYGGYPAPETKHKQLDVNDSIINSIKAKLKELSLYQNYKKRFPVNEKVYIVETGISLNIITDTEKFALSVDGGLSNNIKDSVKDNMSHFFAYVQQLFSEQSK
jgi:hypothetical protein